MTNRVKRRMKRKGFRMVSCRIEVISLDGKLQMPDYVDGFFHQWVIHFEELMAVVELDGEILLFGTADIKFLN